MWVNYLIGVKGQLKEREKHSVREPLDSHNLLSVIIQKLNGKQSCKNHQQLMIL